MEFKKWFVTERAKALAMVLLTRRNELAVAEAKEGSGLDLHVSLGGENGHDKRQFGVIIEGAMTPVSLDQANKHLRTTLTAIGALGAFPYPICVFYFTAKDEQGYSTWAYEPVITAKGLPKLKCHSDAHAVRLNDETMDTIIVSVNKWYDAFYSTITM